MKLKNCVCFLIGFVLIINACKKKNDYLPPDFNYKIDPVNITQNVNVGAYFLNYAVTDWAKKYSDTPVLGEYSSLTASVMAQERTWADSAGVDFFIFNWNGATTGDPVLNNFANGRNNKVRMVINYNTSHLAATNASPLTATKLTTMINEFKSLVANRFTKDYYYTLKQNTVFKANFFRNDSYIVRPRKSYSDGFYICPGRNCGYFHQAGRQSLHIPMTRVICGSAPKM